MNGSVKDALLQILTQKTGTPAGVGKITPVGGGCINESFRAETTAGVFFVKCNTAKHYPGMFEAEAMGLELLGKRTAGLHENGAIPMQDRHKGAGHMLKVPAVVGFGTVSGYSLLVLEYIVPGSMKSDFWEVFGMGLAQLHRQANPYFGLDHHNYIGSLPQANNPHNGWIEFFIAERLEAQLKQARDSQRAGKELGQLFNRMYVHLSDIFPEEPPALLHGDLWNGNYLIGSNGLPAIIDPAVYYGHRYMDLGMSLLFGGFSQAFYSAYDAAYPLEKNWKEGTEIANLYPLLVHLNLFGGSYLEEIQKVLKKFK